MKKINRGFLFYFGILLAILLGAFLICVVIMILSPGTSIFGLKYYKEDKSKSFQTMDVYEYIPNSISGEWFSFNEEGEYQFSVTTKNSGKQNYFVLVDSSKAVNYYVESESPIGLTDINSVSIEGIDDISTVCAIAEGKIAFTKEGTYKATINTEKYVFKVGKDFKYTTYKPTDSPKDVVRVEVLNKYAFENGQLEVFSAGEYVVRSEKNENYFAIATEDKKGINLTYYSIVSEPTISDETSFEIVGEKDPSSICKVEDGKLKFIKEGKFKIKFKTAESWVDYLVYVDSSLTPVYLLDKNLEGKIISINDGGKYSANVSYYIYKNDEEFSKYEINTIKINSNLHNVKIIKSNATYQNYEFMRVYVDNKTSGFTTSSVETLMSVKYYSDTKELVIDALVPEGFWEIGNNSSIFVQIPESINTANVHFEINAGRGDVSFGDVKTDSNSNPNTLYIKSLSVKTTASFGVTNYAVIGDNASGLFGDVYLEAENMSVLSTITANNIVIKTKTGNSNFNVGARAFNAKQSILIDTESSYNHYGEIVCQNNIILKNVYGEQNFSNITGNVVIDDASRKCDYDFNTIDGNLLAGKPATETSKEVKIDSCNIRYYEITKTVDVHTTGKFEKKQ